MRMAAFSLARIVYKMLRFKVEFVDFGADYHEQQYRSRVVHNLEHKAKSLGYQLVPVPSE
jgi:transposase